MQQNNTGYNPGHPWYYLLGGDIPSLKSMWQQVQERGYKSYKKDDIQKAGDKQEPKRSELLRAMRKEAEHSLKQNISIFRKCARELHAFRKQNPYEKFPISCEDIHVTMSLKHNHIYNDFAQLIYIDELLSQQLDLFN